MKKLLSCLLALALAASLTAPMASAAGYTDIPAGSSLAGKVQKAVDYGLMNGYNATTFGYSSSMTRVQFVTVLHRMMGWGNDVHIAMWKSPFKTMEISDETLSETYLYAIEQAVQHDVVDSDVPFRPNDPITRGEMAEMLVRALGLKYAAEQLNSSTIPLSDAYSNLHGGTPFTDLPSKGEGYITVAYSIGLTNGTSATTFSPNATATRAQAAAMLVRIYEKLHQEPDFVHGFYAISSYSQLDLAKKMDAVSAGWSAMTWDGETATLLTTGGGRSGAIYVIPQGYEEVTSTLEENDVPLNLSVFMEGDSLKAMLASESGRKQAVEQIIHEVTVDYKTIGKNPYSGVTIDFEGLRSAQKSDFTAFLTELDKELENLDKALYVCVSPVLSSGYYSGAWYDGYDYAAIAELADKVILMAYDYDALSLKGFEGTEYYKTAAPSPIDQVYLGLKAIVDAVPDTSKIVLGFSAENIVWQIDENGKLLSGTPGHPSAETVVKRLAQTSTEFGWSDTYQQPYAIYTTEDGSRYFLWYQDGRSVQTALNAARLLGVNGVSIWRLGNIPLYTIGGREWNWSGLLQNN